MKRILTFSLFALFAVAVFSQNFTWISTPDPDSAINRNIPSGKVGIVDLSTGSTYIITDGYASGSTLQTMIDSSDVSEVGGGGGASSTNVLDTISAIPKTSFKSRITLNGWESNISILSRVYGTARDSVRFVFNSTNATDTTFSFQYIDNVGRSSDSVVVQSEIVGGNPTTVLKQVYDSLIAQPNLVADYIISYDSVANDYVDDNDRIVTGGQIGTHLDKTDGVIYTYFKTTANPPRYNLFMLKDSMWMVVSQTYSNP